MVCCEECKKKKIDETQRDMSIEVIVLSIVGGMALSVSQCKPTLIIVIVTVVGLLINNGVIDISLQRYGISANRAVTSAVQDGVSSRKTTVDSSQNYEEPSRAPAGSTIRNEDDGTDDNNNDITDDKRKQQLLQTANPNRRLPQTPNTSPSSLPQTANPRASEAGGESTTKEEVDTTSHESTRAASGELKQTPNPRLASAEPQPRTESSTDVGGSHFVFSHMNAAEYTPEGMQQKVQERLFKRKEVTHQTSDERARLLNSMYKDLLSENYKKDPNLFEAGSTGCDLIRTRVREVRHDTC